jgi:hypothetical protein
VQSNGDDSKLNGVDLISSFASSNGAEYPDNFTYVPHPEEPDDLDKPVRCPLPEPCIMHVRAWIFEFFFLPTLLSLLQLFI